MQYPKVEDCKTLIIQYNVDLLKTVRGHIKYMPLYVTYLNLARDIEQYP